MSFKAAVISLLVVVSIAGIAVFFIFGGQKILPAAPSTSQFPGGGLGRPGTVTGTAAVPQGGETTADKPLKEHKNDGFLTFFGTNVTIPAVISDIIKPLLPAATKKFALGEASPVASPSLRPAKPLTEQQVFERIWPQSYRDFLKDVQDLMVKDGFIGASQVRTFSSDKDIFDFIQLMFSYARSKGWISDDQFSKFTADTKGDFIKLIRDEEDALRRGETTGMFLPGYQRFARYSAKDILHDILDGIGYVIMQAKPAYAGWHTGQDCYKDDDPSSKKKGSNSKAFCCNCGYYCTITCVYKQDCGEKGKNCNVQLGCLNRICEGKPNAIWDKESGTCGCDGAGGGGGGGEGETGGQITGGAENAAGISDVSNSLGSVFKDFSSVLSGTISPELAQKIGDFLGKQLGSFIADKLGSLIPSGIADKIGSFIGEKLGSQLGEGLSKIISSFDSGVMPPADLSPATDGAFWTTASSIDSQLRQQLDAEFGPAEGESIANEFSSKTSSLDPSEATQLANSAKTELEQNLAAEFPDGGASEMILVDCKAPTCGGGVVDPNEQLLRNNLDNMVRDRFAGFYKGAFDYYAKDGSLGPNELKILLKDIDVGNTFTRGMWASGIIKRFDTNGDGRVDFGEFLQGAGKGLNI